MGRARIVRRIVFGPRVAPQTRAGTRQAMPGKEGSDSRPAAAPRQTRQIAVRLRVNRTVPDLAAWRTFVVAAAATTGSSE